MRMQLGLALALAGSLACSEHGSGARGEAGTAGLGGASGSELTAGAGGAATAGGTGGGAGSAGAGAALEDLTLGDVLEFVAGAGDVPYAIGDNPYGIVGGAFLARSDFGNTISIDDTPGEICISGNLEEVPAGNYGQYWGVEIGFNLNQVTPGSPAPDPFDAGPFDAGPDAAAPSSDADAAASTPDIAEPWQPGRVIGFSYVIEGPSINLVRFKALPDGFDPALESSVFCKTVEATSGVAEASLFTEMTQYCWSPNNPPLPTSAGLDNISWQLPADVAPAGQRPFDWCLKQLRPILAEP